MNRTRLLSSVILTIVLAACTTSSPSNSQPTATGGKVALSGDVSALTHAADVTGVWVQLTPTGGGSALSAWATFASARWTVSFAAVPAGSYDVYAKAVDASNKTLYETPTPYPGGPITVSVGATTTVALVLQEPPTTTGNHAPVIGSLYANQTQIDANATVQLSASASDPDAADTIAFAWAASGGGFSAVTSDATTSRATWTPPGTGTFSITLAVTDNHGVSAQQSIDVVVTAVSTTGGVAISITLNDAPVVLSLTSTNAQAGAGKALPLSVVASDPDGDPLTFRWSASCDGTFVDGGTTPDPLGTRASTVFTPSDVPASGACVLSVEVDDGRGGSTIAQLGVSFATPVVGSGPAFLVQASPSAFAPGQRPELRVLPNDGLPHAGWSYAWSDGLIAPQAGAFVAQGGDPSDVRYASAFCADLGGGPVGLSISVTVTDAVSGLSNSASVPLTLQCPPLQNLTTETLYQPQQPLSTYEPPPAGFAPVYTELVARHGARGMSSEGDDLAVYAMWLQAQADGALTPLGQQLGPDLLAFIQANTTLGAGVSGITAPGYGNLSALGAAEHQQLAARLLQRLPDHFAQVAASSRQIVVQTSGVNRAYDSSGFFTRALAAASPALSALVTYPPAITGYGTKPKAQLPGTNRFLLYFHKLTSAQDQVTSSSDSNYATYQASLAYQTFKSSDPIQKAKVSAISAIPDFDAAAHAVLERLFTPEFVAKLGTAGYVFKDTGTFTYTGADGKQYTTTGAGGTTLDSALAAANSLYGIFIIAPALQTELGGIDFGKYFPAPQAEVFAYLADATDFYQMGPGATEDGNATYAMARGLLDDFFMEVDAIAGGNMTNGAKLRFTHAEIVVPFTSILNVPGIFAHLPQAQTYTYLAGSAWNADLTAPTPIAWRDDLVAPMAGNVQWDVVRDASGRLLVKMLLDEQEVDFSSACDAARFAPGSRYYDYAGLAACYGHVAQ